MPLVCVLLSIQEACIFASFRSPQLDPKVEGGTAYASGRTGHRTAITLRSALRRCTARSDSSNLHMSDSRLFIKAYCHGVASCVPDSFKRKADHLQYIPLTVHKFFFEAFIVYWQFKPLLLICFGQAEGVVLRRRSFFFLLPFLSDALFFPKSVSSANNNHS